MVEEQGSLQMDKKLTYLRESYGIQADKMNVAFAGKDVDSGERNGDLGAE